MSDSPRSLVPVVLSGGEGTRLWPLSTPSAPKQFGQVVPGDSLFTRCLRRFAGQPGFADPIVVTSHRHVDLVRASAAEASVDLALVIAEPTGRNTAPAAVAAALVAAPDQVLVILPSDHLIRRDAEFVEAVDEAAELAAAGNLVTFGVVPNRPETGYGYIQPGEPLGAGFRVARFTEKPGETEARRMMETGYLWNSGMFVVTARLLLDEASEHCPGVLDGVSSAMTPATHGEVRLSENFSEVEAISIDVAIAEKTDRAAVVPIDVGWSDIGSFQALWEAMEHDEDGNAVSGPTVLANVRRSLVKATSRAVAVAGLDDIVVVETEDAVLVTRRETSQMVRDVVSMLDSADEPVD